MAELFDSLVRHQIYVEGLKAGKGLEFFETITKLTAELRKALGDIEYANLGDMTKTALNKLLIALRKAIRRIFDPWLRSLLRWLEQYCRVEVEMYSSIFGVDWADPDPIYKAAESEPIPGNGLFMVPFLRGFGVYSLTRIERLVVMGRANRRTAEEVLREFTGTKRRRFKDGMAVQLQRLSNAAISTAIQHINTQTNFAVSRAKFDQYEWVSVLDDRTTNICWQRDGQRYEYGKGPVPPAHVNCRSTIMPVYRRSPKTPDFDFEMWAREQPAEFIDDALDGKASSRYERSNPLTLIGFAGKGPIIRL